MSVKSGPGNGQWGTSSGNRIMVAKALDACGARRLAGVVQSNRQDTVTQMAKDVNSDSDRKDSEYLVHRSQGCLAGKGGSTQCQA